MIVTHGSAVDREDPVRLQEKREERMEISYLHPQRVSMKLASSQGHQKMGKGKIVCAKKMGLRDPSALPGALQN